MTCLRKIYEMCVKYEKLFWHVKKIFFKIFLIKIFLRSNCVFTHLHVLFANCAKFALAIANAAHSVNPLIALLIILLFNWLRLRIAYLKHILWLKVCERTVLTVLKSILSNTFHRGDGCRPEDVKFLVLSTTATFSALVNVTQEWLKNSQTLLIIKYAVYIVGCVWFVFNGKT